MKKDRKELEQYIEELEDSLVELKFKLKNANNALIEEKKANHKRIQKSVHNLKNPIGVIYSFSEMIGESGGDLDPEKLLKFNEVIYNSSKYSIEVLNAISTINKLNNNSFELQKEAQNYCSFVEEVISKFKLKHKTEELAINISTSNAEINAEFDADLLELVLKNILNNCLDYSENPIEVSINIEDKGGVVETKISDNGMGVLEEDLQKIFDEFFVVNTYNVNQKKCVGLGLSIAKKVILAHKGTIKAMSKIKQGTSITFSIPKN